MVNESCYKKDLNRLVLFSKDLLPIIFSFLPFNVYCQLVCKEWNGLYKYAIGIYPINIELKCWINQEQFNKVCRYYNKIHTLDISHCLGINDISLLKGIHTLDMTNCGNITDLTSLQHIHTLCMMDCCGITDLTPLQGIHTLNMGNCYNIKDISPLGRQADPKRKGIKVLHMAGCKGVTDLSPLKGILELDIWGCDQITDISFLEF